MLLIKQYLDKGLTGVNILFLIVLVLSVVYQVVARFIFNSPSTVVDEFTQITFMWLILLGGTYTAGQGQHLAIDILKRKMRGTNRLILVLFINLLVFLFGVIFMVYGGAQLMNKSAQMAQISPSLGWQMKNVYGVLPFSGVILAFYALTDMFRAFSDNQ